MKKTIRYFLMPAIAVVGITGIAPAQQPTSKAPMLTLNSGRQMPQFGLGTDKTPSHEVAKEAVMFALNPHCSRLEQKPLQIN